METQMAQLASGVSARDGPAHCFRTLHGGKPQMKFARVVFTVAAVYGFITLVPFYFMLHTLERRAPPPVTHQEFYYGFVGLALLWQMVFVLVAKDPLRYRPIMPIAILEKLVYSVPVVILYWLGKASASILGPALADPVLGVLFVIAYFRPAAPRDGSVLG